MITNKHISVINTTRGKKTGTFIKIQTNPKTINNPIADIFIFSIQKGLATEPD